MKIDVISLFPKMVETFFLEGVVSRAIRNDLLSLDLINLRDFTDDVHKTVDNRPYGGGPGMVMLYDVVHKALNHIKEKSGRGYRIYLSPQGKVLNQKLIEDLAQKEHLVLLCGRYEGIDERIIQGEIDLECSIGDYVLSGGELAAGVVIDTVARQLPNVLGHKDSKAFDSFATGLLDHPHYTKPKTVDGKEVPSVLQEGNHKKINDFRHQQALGRTWVRRPDLFAKKALSREELELLNDFLKQNRNN